MEVHGQHQVDLGPRSLQEVQVDLRRWPEEAHSLPAAVLVARCQEVHRKEVALRKAACYAAGCISG